MPSGVPRFALWALVAMMLATTLVVAPGALATNGPSAYVLSGHVTTAGAVPVPAGVAVDLISGSTHQTYTTQTTTGGGYSFTYASTSDALVPGTWGVWVPPQGNITLNGHPAGVLPANPKPSFFYETAQNLTSISSAHPISGVTVLKYNATIFGNATDGSTPASGANVELLAPTYNGFVLSNNTTLTAGNFSLKVPWGTWVLRTTLPGSPISFDYQQVIVGSGTVVKSRLTVNPSISNYLTHGTVYQASSSSAEVPFGGNATVYETSTQDIYSNPFVGGGYYEVGTYPAGFTGGGANNFEVTLQSIGQWPASYQTLSYPLTVSGANTTGTSPHDVLTPSQYVPAVYNTNLSYSKNFKWLNATTTATLGNDSVFPELPNASVGQLWAQLALDWQHNLTFNSANMATVRNWIQSEGPFFPAGQAQAVVNSTGYNESNTGFFTSGAGCAVGYCGLTSSTGITYSWVQNYSLNGTAPSNASSYPVAFNFRHPTNFQAINYTISLPAGYTLQAGNSAPAGATLIADGPGGTWTKFTLVSKPWSTASGTASFTFVKFGKITANVTASVSAFTFAKQNVLNSTHGNYSVVVGTGQNVTFSAASSTFPTGTNGSRYVWTWGDASAATTTTQVTTYHTFAAVGKYVGNLNVTSSGGTSANVTFNTLVGGSGISGNIVSNASAWEKRVSNGVPYLWVNYSTSLNFNGTGFNSSLGFPGAPKGLLSVAAWNATDGRKNQTSNFTAGNGAYVPDNFTVLFNAAGDTQYLSTATIGGTAIPFLGWQYNITVRVWDAVGKYATQRLDVLVQDTQKPNAVSTVQDASNKNVTGSALTESSNHTVEVKLVGSFSSDPNGGSLVKYAWNLTNSGNSSISGKWVQTNRTGYRAPLPEVLWLQPQSKAYSINLTVTDRAGNTAYNVATFTVAVNASTRPVLSVGNLSAPTSMTDQSSYTIWVNVTNTLGVNSSALNVMVRFYLLPPSGTGSQIGIGGSPGSVQFYYYNNATGAPFAGPANATGSLAKLTYNTTVRAQITFIPARVGTYDIWANATASNEFAGNYATGGNQAHVQVQLNANPIIEYETAGAVIGGVILVALLAIWWFRYRGKGSSKSSSGRSSGSDKSGKKDKVDTKSPSSSDKDEDDE
ncbi:MAG: hypothetical protein L3K08_04700 [Thermoplasmata archaeon]|nr:hypothetical protein [Thermoplasmata archaeon]